MRKSLLLIICLIVAIGSVFAQEMRTDKVFVLSAKMVAVVADNVCDPDWFHAEDAIVKFGQGRWRWYCFANDITAKKQIWPPANSVATPKPGLTVDGDSARLEFRNMRIIRHSASLGAGLSFGTDSLRVYGGIGYSLDRQARGNLGVYYIHPNYSVSALADIASGDWRYDIKILTFGIDPKPPIAIGIGAYAKTHFGFGLMGQIEPLKQLIISAGFGHDSEADTKTKFKMWAGLSLAL